MLSIGKFEREVKTWIVSESSQKSPRPRTEKLRLRQLSSDRGSEVTLTKAVTKMNLDHEKSCKCDLIERKKVEFS